MGGGGVQTVVGAASRLRTLPCCRASVKPARPGEAPVAQLDRAPTTDLGVRSSNSPGAPSFSNSYLAAPLLRNLAGNVMGNMSSGNDAMFRTSLQPPKLAVTWRLSVLSKVSK